MSSFRRAFTLLELLLVTAIATVLAGLLSAALLKARDAALRGACANNMRQMGLALHGYHDSYGVLPPGVRTRKDKYLYLSWQARILPWLEENGLWSKVSDAFATCPDFWIVPPHGVRETTLSLYLCPASSRFVGNPQPENVRSAFTYYLGVSGVEAGMGDGVLYWNSRVRIADVRDGTSTTLIVGERPPSSDERFGWWYAGIGQNYTGRSDSYQAVRERNDTFYAPTCPKGPYSFRAGSDGDMCSTFHFWSRHAGGATFLLVDGSARFMAYGSDSILAAFASRSGQEGVDLR